MLIGLTSLKLLYTTHIPSRIPEVYLIPTEQMLIKYFSLVTEGELGLVVETCPTSTNVLSVLRINS